MTGRTYHPRGIGFFELVHLLERLHESAAPIGTCATARQELVRFRPDLTFDFPPRDLESVEVVPLADGQRPRFDITATFLGLYGTESPLPRHYTDRLLADEPEAQARVRGFLDLFHNRIYALFYRAWRKYRYHVGITDCGPGLDPTSERLLCLLGYGTPGLRQRAGLGDQLQALRLLRWAGLSTQRPRSAAVVRAILQDRFSDVPLRIRQCVPRRVVIPPRSRAYLGGRAAAQGGERVPVRRLGREAVLGTHVTDRSSRLRVVIGPLDYDQYQAFLPGTPRRRLLDELVRRTAPRHLTHEVELILRGPEVPALRLGRPDARLGWTSWIAQRPGPDHSVTFSSRAPLRPEPLGPQAPVNARPKLETQP